MKNEGIVIKTIKAEKFLEMLRVQDPHKWRFSEASTHYEVTNIDNSNHRYTTRSIFKEVPPIEYILVVPTGYPESEQDGSPPIEVMLKEINRIGGKGSILLVGSGDSPVGYKKICIMRSLCCPPLLIPGNSSYSYWWEVFALNYNRIEEEVLSLAKELRKIGLMQ